MISITSHLSCRTDPGGVDVVVGTHRVARVRARSGRVDGFLALLDGHRLIDVGPQPRAIATLLRQRATRVREDPNRWCRGVARVVYDEAVERWTTDGLPDDDRDDLDALLASLTFPLLRVARNHGAGPVPFVPRWAMPALRAPDAAGAVRALFGGVGTRPMVRALPEGMLAGAGAPDAGAPDLRPLGLAFSLRHVLDGDRLATVLAGTGGWRPPHHWPTDDEMRTLARVWPCADPATATALALDALTVDHGPARLARALHLVEPVAAVSDIPLARSVVALEAQALGATPAVAPRLPRQRRPAPPDEPPVALPAQPLIAPAGGRPAPGPATGTFRYPPTIEVAHGYRLGDYRFVLPRGRADLVRWGRLLRNCLADYADAVEAARSVVIGFEERDRLVAALEITARDRTVRQFVGVGNRRPDATRRHACSRMLRDLGLAD